MKNSIDRIAREVRLELVHLESLVDKEYPLGSVVWVENRRYEGYGIITREDGVRPTLLPVCLENGNVWHYEVDTITIAPRELWPKWIIKKKRSDAAKKSAATRKRNGYISPFKGCKVALTTPPEPQNEQ